MRQSFYILTTSLILATLTSFQTNFKIEDKVVLSNDNNSDTFIIWKTTIEDVFKKYGKTNVETKFDAFSSNEDLYNKRQTITYLEKGLTFKFESIVTDSNKEKLSENICFLNKIWTTKNYCIDGFCNKVAKTELLKKLKDGKYPEVYSASDSTNISCYSLGLTFIFARTGQTEKLIETRRTEKSRL